MLIVKHLLDIMTALHQHSEEVRLGVTVVSVLLRPVVSVKTQWTPAGVLVTLI